MSQRTIVAVALTLAVVALILGLCCYGRSVDCHGHEEPSRKDAGFRGIKE